MPECLGLWREREREGASRKAQQFQEESVWSFIKVGIQGKLQGKGEGWRYASEAKTLAVLPKKGFNS